MVRRCGCRNLWYVVAAGLFIGCLFARLDSARSGVFLVAWLWPALLWSQPGTREARFSTQAMIFSAPHAFSEAALILLDGRSPAGFTHRRRSRPAPMLARDTQGLFGGLWPGFSFRPWRWLGVCTESHKPFEAVYTAWWYIGPLHQMRKLDFIGTRPVSSTPALYLAASIMLLLLAENKAIPRVTRDPFKLYRTRHLLCDFGGRLWLQTVGRLRFAFLTDATFAAACSTLL